jgi:hypothetical protein
VKPETIDMGAAATVEAKPFDSIEDALAGGKTQEEVEKWIQDNAKATDPPAEAATEAAAAEEPAAAQPAAAQPTAAQPAAAQPAATQPTAEAATMSPIQECSLQTWQAAADAAVAQGKWPLLLDSNENAPLITFLQYQHFHMVEVKKGMVEVSVQKTKQVEEVQEEWRGAVRDCMVQKPDLGSSPGKTLWLHFANSAVDFKGTYCNDTNLSLDLFDCQAMQNEETKKKFLKEGEFQGASIW